MDGGIYSFMDMEPGNEDVFCYLGHFQAILELWQQHQKSFYSSSIFLLLSFTCLYIVCVSVCVCVQPILNVEIRA